MKKYYTTKEVKSKKEALPMKKQNKWEKLFDEYLDLIEFKLIKHQNDYDEYHDEIGYYGLIDIQMANLGDIQSRRYKTAAQILDDLDSYLEDYIISPLLDCLDEVSLDPQNPISNSFWSELLKYKNLIPENEWDFNVLDMICNHFEEINLENCTYEEVK